MNEKICETLIENIFFYGDQLYYKIRAGSILSWKSLRINIIKRMRRLDQYEKIWWVLITNKDINITIILFRDGCWRYYSEDRNQYIDSEDINELYKFMSSFNKENMIDLTIMLQTRVMDICI